MPKCITLKMFEIKFCRIVISSFQVKIIFVKFFEMKSVKYFFKLLPARNAFLTKKVKICIIFYMGETVKKKKKSLVN